MNDDQNNRSEQTNVANNQNIDLGQTVSINPMHSTNNNNGIMQVQSNNANNFIENNSTAEQTSHINSTQMQSTVKNQSVNNINQLNMEQQSTTVPNQSTTNGSASHTTNWFKNNKIIKFIGIVIVVFLVIAILLSLGKNNNSKYKKVLSCTTHMDTIGIVGDKDYVFNINDGELEIKTTMTYQLNKFHSSDYDTADKLDAFAQKQISDGKKECANGSCTFKYDYVKGNKIVLIVSFSKNQSTETLGSGIANYTANEIYNKLKTAMETGQMGDYRVYTCN